MNTYEVWIGHVKSVNLKRVVPNQDRTNVGDEINFFYTLAMNEETPVECL